MGNYIIEIEAVGGHGCERHVKDGGTNHGCHQFGCPDCETRAFVKHLKAQGNSIQSATFTHWPGQPSEVKDDLLTGIRTGSF